LLPLGEDDQRLGLPTAQLLNLVGGSPVYASPSLHYLLALGKRVVQIVHDVSHTYSSPWARRSIACRIVAGSCSHSLAGGPVCFLTYSTTSARRRRAAVTSSRTASA